MSRPGLSEFQIEPANLFFSLPESAGFLLAGGGALIAQGIVPRPTEDLDFFTARQVGDVEAASDALIMSAYDLICRSGYDLMCRSRRGDHGMGSPPATRLMRSLSR